MNAADSRTVLFCEKRALRLGSGDGLFAKQGKSVSDIRDTNVKAVSMCSRTAR